MQKPLDDFSGEGEISHATRFMAGEEVAIRRPDGTLEHGWVLSRFVDGEWEALKMVGEGVGGSVEHISKRFSRDEIIKLKAE